MVVLLLFVHSLVDQSLLTGTSLSSAPTSDSSPWAGTAPTAGLLKENSYPCDGGSPEGLGGTCPSCWFPW